MSSTSLMMPGISFAFLSSSSASLEAGKECHSDSVSVAFVFVFHLQLYLENVPQTYANGYEYLSILPYREEQDL